MKNYKEQEQVAEQILNSINNLQQLEANEYLYAKIIQRMQHKNKTIAPAYNRLMLRMVAVLLLFICLNGVSYYVLKQHTVHTTVKQTSGTDAFADAYGLNNNLDSY